MPSSKVKYDFLPKTFFIPLHKCAQAGDTQKHFVVIWRPIYIKACRNGKLHLKKILQYGYGLNLILASLFTNYAKIQALCCYVRLYNMKSIKSKIYTVVSKQ